MLFPFHELIHAPSRVQAGMAVTLVGGAWLVAGVILRQMRGVGRIGSLRAFAGVEEWRWLGVLLVLGGLCVARPWGMDCNPWVWVRHSALLVAALAAGHLFSVGRSRDLAVSVCVLVLVILQLVLSLWVGVRLGADNLADVPWFGMSYLPDGFQAAAIVCGLAALGVGLWRAVRVPLRAGALHTVALVVLLPVFGDCVMMCRTVDRLARESMHQRAMDSQFGEESVPAGLNLPEGCEIGEPESVPCDPCSE